MALDSSHSELRALPNIKIYSLFTHLAPQNKISILWICEQIIEPTLFFATATNTNHSSLNNNRPKYLKLDKDIYLQELQIQSSDLRSTWTKASRAHITFKPCPNPKPHSNATMTSSASHRLSSPPSPPCTNRKAYVSSSSTIHPTWNAPTRR